jgi:hypothetical protein
VGTGKTIFRIEKNQYVFKQGDVADTVFYIQRGSVKLTVRCEQGKEAVVGILEPGQFFGERCLNGQPMRIATTATMKECLITSITKEVMIASLRTRRNCIRQTPVRKSAYLIVAETNYAVKITYVGSWYLFRTSALGPMSALRHFSDLALALRDVC